MVQGVKTRPRTGGVTGGAGKRPALWASADSGKSSSSFLCLAIEPGMALLPYLHVYIHVHTTACDKVKGKSEENLECAWNNYNAATNA